ncbi:hypothetical protein DM01DRAFT_1409369 [Hesseltinella vesiculosa]|uniref:VPS9 domain-containing protein n=1 Tax=Hesseltinella vesiculosa TaxID=101127 RepID=A0A1X2GBK6_9FUNG|nr:hypothetical protein DM01DRAFT_1409369 [Hesseltinella vesiculosa]
MVMDPSEKPSARPSSEVDGNDLAKQFHKASLEDEVLDEKEALRQEQADLDDLLQDTPPPSRSTTATPDDAHDTAAHDQQNDRNEELQYIFNQFNDADQEVSVPAEDQQSINDSIRRPSLIDIKQKPLPPPVDVPFDFNKFLWQMRRRGASPITRYFKSFLQAFDRRPWAVNEQIKIIQDFLDFIFVKMRECEVWKYCTEQEFDNAKEGMEKLVMNRLYNATFSPNTTDDKERDEILQQKISIFRWIREKHLDIVETEHNESFLKFAESELLKINNYKAPRDKLICILNCCKVIFGLLKHVDDGDSSADKFLPILIFVVLRANPPRLVSNVQYISRFRNPEHLQAEAGYYLTNLMGAISFIETMEANSLSISKEEFDANIERTMVELRQERPDMARQDKQKINYDNVVHPSHAPPSSSTSPPLLDSMKAANLLEKGSTFAQKTMQKPLNFVGKIFQGLGEPTEEELQQQQQQQYQQQLLERQQQQYYQQQQQLLHQQQQMNANRPLPRQGPDPRRIFDDNLKTIVTMFPNVEPDVCFMILQANENDVNRTIDTLLEISDPSVPKVSPATGHLIDIQPEQTTHSDHTTPFEDPNRD